jgi:hypothetical protein
MEDLIVTTKQQTVERTITQIIYSYEFQDRNGFKVKGENIGSESDMLREIEIKTRKLKDYNVVIKNLKQ